MSSLPPPGALPRGVPPAAADGHGRWVALAVVLVASLMDLLDVTIVNAAIPGIRRDLGAGYAAVQWVTVDYALAFALLLITGGRLGDIFGRRRLFLIGMAGFTAASGLCGIAWNADVLVWARLLQGTMAALMVPQVLAIIHVSFAAHERGRVYGRYGLVVGTAGICGPVLGGMLVERNLFGLEWRPVFLVNLPIGLIGLVLARRYVHESKAPGALRLDLVGVGLAALGLFALIYPLIHGRDRGWPVRDVVVMAASVPLLALFVVYERYKTGKDGSPLVVLSLFRARSFASGLAVQLTFSVAIGILFLPWTLYLQLGLGWAPRRAGLMGIPLAVAVATAAGLSLQLLVPRFGRRVLQAGVLLMITGLACFTWQIDRHGTDMHYWSLALPLALCGTGLGLVLAPLADIVLTDVPQADAGSASGLISTNVQLGNAFGVALTSVLFFDELGGRAGAGGQDFSRAFQHLLYWVIGVMAAVFTLMFALPRHVRRPEPHHTAGAVHDGEPVT
ncbi:MFS transporter [Streptomyces griseocarneus]|nr:MFS transporter [Streptomyces griseocarneus]